MILTRMSNAMGLPESDITSIAKAASHSYKQYTIPKKSGGVRTIYHPARPLKALQRWLAKTIILNWPVHSAAMAYRPGVSILDNAMKHRESRYLLRMDFAEFFSSIKEADIRRYLLSNQSLVSNWSPPDVDLFCSIVLRNGSLTIGAPTSPALANALCYDMDDEFSRLCSKHQVVYTRYADDLFFSTIQPDVLSVIETAITTLVNGMSLPGQLALNTAKTRHSSKKGARRVTGIVLGSDGNVHIGRQLKRQIRAMLHSHATLSPEDRATLRGLLAYAVGFDPDFKNSLIAKYGLDLVRKVSVG